MHLQGGPGASGGNWNEKYGGYVAAPIASEIVAAAGNYGLVR